MQIICWSVWLEALLFLANSSWPTPARWVPLRPKTKRTGHSSKERSSCWSAYWRFEWIPKSMIPSAQSPRKWWTGWYSSRSPLWSFWGTSRDPCRWGRYTSWGKGSALWRICWIAWPPWGITGVSKEWGCTCSRLLSTPNHHYLFLGNTPTLICGERSMRVLPDIADMDWWAEPQDIVHTSTWKRAASSYLNFMQHSRSPRWFYSPAAADA